MPAAALMLLPALSASAITYTYGEFNKSAKTCTLMSWGGQQPSSGKLVLKETYEQDGTVYKVTAIAAHALDNLTEVTEITIPANVKAIGENYGDYVASCLNFNNCPKLKTFKVATGSTAFSATGAGILVKKSSMLIIARVPEGIEVTNGTLNLSKSTKDICADAFAGNTTITTLGLSPNQYEPATNCGFNDMKMLREFKVNGTYNDSDLNYRIMNGVLYSHSANRIISFPPARPDAGFTIPDDVRTIGDYAFANTANLRSVDFRAVTSIGEQAFRNCGLTSVELPVNEIELGRGVFRGSQKLEGISFPAKLSLPADFARDCWHLKSVYVHSSFTTFDDCAFKDCISLDTFNFRPDMTFEGDSIFAGCGFRQVDFSSGATRTGGMKLGRAMFANNGGLVKVDLSKLVMTSEENSLEIMPSCFSDCPWLQDVSLPRLTRYWSAVNETAPNFGVNPAIRQLVTGAFHIGDKPAMVYDETATTSPSIYVRTTDALAKSWPLGDLVGVSAGSKVKPVIFCEAFTMRDAASGDESEYVVPGAVYYVPGGTFNNYAAAMQTGCPVILMYDISTGNEGGTFNVGVHSNIGDGIEFLRLNINNEWSCEPDADGRFVTTYAPQDVNTYDLEYMCQGVLFRTRYPKPDFSGIDEIAVGDITMAGGMMSFGAEAAYTVADMTGANVADGRGASLDISRLGHGVYVVTVTFDDGRKAVRKVRI